MHLENRHFLLIVIFIAVLEGVALVIAYGGFQPDVMGHSSGEVMVNIGGVDKSLQQAIDDGDFGGEGVAFGGMYMTPDGGGCYTVNPVTGACSCPSGFSSQTFRMIAMPGAAFIPVRLIFCYKV